MVIDYVAAGFDPSTFWSLCPREFDLHMRGARARIQAEHENARWSAWHIAALGRVEKLPDLADFMTLRADEAAEQDTQKLMMAMQDLHARYKDR